MCEGVWILGGQAPASRHEAVSASGAAVENGEIGICGRLPINPSGGLIDARNFGGTATAVSFVVSAAQGV